MVLMQLPLRPNRAPTRARHVLVIGGGASGVLVAVHVLRSDPAVRVSLIERDGFLGCGIAYATRDPNHLLNTRVSSMSAYPDDPDHFLQWLRREGVANASPFAFVGRAVYGRYMANLLDPWRHDDRLSCLRVECIGVREDDRGVLALLADGGALAADAAVLATGHVLPEPERGPEAVVTQPWSNTPPPGPRERVLIVGSGLTMVDQVLSLLAAGHAGEIVVVSRRGLLPRRHADVAADPIAETELPKEARTLALTRWLRARVSARVAAGGDWRSVVDGLRPHVQRLWQAMPTEERARFLRHACAWWEVHRHRMPPPSAEALSAAETSGQLVLRRGAFLGACRGEAGEIIARIRGRGANVDEAIPAARVVDCRGIRRDPEAHAGPLLRDLLDRGQARIDPLRLGIDVDRRCRVLRADGSACDRLLAIGPVSRAAFWEITAIPDIREQAAKLAAELVHLADSQSQQ